MEQQKSVGPLKAIGLALGAVSSMVQVIDNSVKTTGNVLNEGLKGINTVTTAGSSAIEIVTSNALEELREDNEVESVVRRATNKVRIAQAEAEAERILATLQSPTTES